jgi:hypothetical protein
MRDYAQAIEEVVSGRTAASYNDYRSMYDSISAHMIAYIFKIDIGIVFGDIRTAKEEIEIAKKAARKAASQVGNEERRQANLARRRNDDANRSTD